MSVVHKLVLSQVKSLLSESDIVVISIDGPTAAGKTILAENIGDKLKKELKINVDYFRLDWTLKERTERQKDLKKLLKNDDDFLLEGELHMKLDIFRDFLNYVKQLKNNSEIYQKEKKIKLSGLYSRENNGQCSGTYIYDFSQKTVIICEGHYTSRTEYSNLIDLNICLLCEKDELLRRKVERVKSYRSSNDAIDYFWKIDIPSFSYYLERYKYSVDFFIENSDYNNPKILPNKDASKWIKLKDNELKSIFFKDYINVDFSKIYFKIFSRSELNYTISVRQLNEIFDFHKFIDNVISKRLQENLDLYEEGIKDLLNREIDKLNVSLNKDNQPKIKIKSSSNSFLYDVYNRRIPISFGISISTQNQTLHLNYTVHMYKCEIIFFWEGGVFEFSINRSLTNRKDKINSNKVEFKNLIDPSKSKKNNEKIKLYSPTDFCIPEFLKEFKFDKIFTGREHERTLLMDILRKLMQEDNSVLSHRLLFNSEIAFYSEFLNCIGIPSIKVANYLIAINSHSNKLLNAYKLWVKSWISTDNKNFQDHKKYDDLVLKELSDADKFISSFSKNFFFIDSFLFCKENNNIELEIKELSIMLNSQNRSVRKRAFQYILKEEPSLEIDTKNLFEVYKIKEDLHKCDNFEVADLPKILPSIMAELYLWQHLRGDNSAILGANIYDISEDNSLDINSILKVSIKNNTAVVFQASFNAIGQKEIEKNEIFQGYLMLDNGPEKLVNACISSVIKSIVLNKSNYPFYGIGLDHVDVKNDLPKNRASRFIDLALSTGNITHVVLDGSHLFNSKNRSIRNLYEAYRKVAEYEVDLINKNQNLFLIDLEFCVGEMNYIGDSKNSMIPNQYEINLFIDILRNELREIGQGHFNCRPSLFIGNVGTTHHSSDNNSDIDSSISNSWVNLVKNKNFISSVLHGTTNSNLKILTESTGGCHKVNVAGDFLNSYISALPKRLPEEIRKFAPESKYFMPKITNMRKSFSKEEINNIEEQISVKSSNIINGIKSPELTERDRSYFHRSSYKFPPKLIDYILKEYKKIKGNKIIKNFSKINKQDLYFSASMIEVPFEDGFCEIVDQLINEGIKHFHIDVGDGKLISRKFSGLKKLYYLSSLNKNLKLHTHLMVKDPLGIDLNCKSYIDNYIDSGSTSIALHLTSFKEKNNLKKAINYIQKRNCRPGILIEITDTNLNYIWDTIDFLKISWVVVMGVPIGFGGQLFQSRCLRTINYIRSKAIENNKNSFDIEVDGGLNFSNINSCREAGANIFAGWSIIKDDEIDKISRKYRKVISQLRNC